MQAIAKQLEESQTDIEEEDSGSEDETAVGESSIWKEVSEDDDPELQELARQIAELERQEQEEKKKAKKVR